jgi:hypothetical protein
VPPHPYTALEQCLRELRASTWGGSNLTFETLRMPLLSEHVEKALDKIDQEGCIPGRERSKLHCLVTRGRHYPPKRVVGQAYYWLNGHALKPEEHYGGKPANDQLIALGYVIKACSCRNSKDFPNCK